MKNLRSVLPCNPSSAEDIVGRLQAVQNTAMQAFTREFTRELARKCQYMAIKVLNDWNCLYVSERLT